MYDEEAAKVNNHLLWPWKFWLPLTRFTNDGVQQLGIIHWQDKTTVYVGISIFHNKQPELLVKVPTVKYPTIEAMLAEWRVD